MVFKCFNFLTFTLMFILLSTILNNFPNLANQLVSIEGRFYQECRTKVLI